LRVQYAINKKHVNPVTHSFTLIYFIYFSTNDNKFDKLEHSTLLESKSP